MKRTALFISTLCLLSLAACVSQDDYDNLDLKYKSLERKLSMEQQRGDTLQWYIDHVLPRLNKGGAPLPVPSVVRPSTSGTSTAKYEEVNDAFLDSLASVSPEAITVARGTATKSGSIKHDLKALRATGVKIMRKRNQLVLVLDNALTFQSGSTSLSPKGKQTLAKVASLLKKDGKHLFLIEGHTDNTAVSNLGTIKDNWDLSVMRASTVVKTLAQQGVNPAQLIAAGRGEYESVAPNTQEANKRLNRRVEIVITPWNR